MVSENEPCSEVDQDTAPVGSEAPLTVAVQRVEEPKSTEEGTQFTLVEEALNGGSAEGSALPDFDSSLFESPALAAEPGEPVADWVRALGCALLVPVVDALNTLAFATGET
jgi:hypothetical protein